VASLVLGILGFATWFITGIPAVICGHVALSKIKKSRGSLTGGGMAIAGLVMGYLSMGLLLIVATSAAMLMPALYR